MQFLSLPLVGVVEQLNGGPLSTDHNVTYKQALNYSTQNLPYCLILIICYVILSVTFLQDVLPDKTSMYLCFQSHLVLCVESLMLKYDNFLIISPPPPQITPVTIMTLKFKVFIYGNDNEFGTTR